MRVLAEMEISGVRIDTEALRRSSADLGERLAAIEQEIYKLAGTSFNISSARQVGEILFERLKIDEKARKTKTGQYSTTEEVLEKLRYRHPIVDKILTYRGLRKLLSTYIDALPELSTGPRARYTPRSTRRLPPRGVSVRATPTCKTFPFATRRDVRYAAPLSPEEGSLFFSADYSQIELRIMAHLSGDRP